MPPFYDTLTASRRRRTVPGLADEPGLDAYLTADDYMAAPGLAPDDPIEREVSAALASEGLGAGMEFTPDEAAEADRTAPQYTVPTTLAEAMPSLSRVAPQLAELGRRGGSFLSQLATNTAPRPLPVAPAADVFATPNAPAPVVAGAVPAGAPPAVSPSSPGAQPQGAGAATPPGQPAPSPVTPAPSSDQPTGQAKNVPAGVRVPGARENKGMDTFGMTDTERARLEEARRGDRRMRIGSGIAQGLGALLGTIGVATDTPGLAGLGMTGMQVGRAIPAGRRAEEVLGDVERRQQAVAAQNASDLAAQEAQRAAGQLDVNRLQAETQRLGAESEAELDRVRAADMAAQQAARENSVTGMREAIRARIASMGANNPSRSAHLNFAQRGGELDSITDMDALERIYVEIGDQDVRRGGQGAGGSGGGRTEEVTVRLPDGSYRTVTRQVRGTQRRPAPSADPFAAPVAPAEAPGAVPATGAPVAATGARPGRPAARRGRSAAAAPAPVAAPVPVPGGAAVPTGTVATDAAEGTPIDTTTGASLERYRMALERAGYDLTDPLVVAQVEEYSLNRSGGSEAARARASEMLNRVLAEANEAQAQGRPARVSEAQWNVARTRLAPVLTQVRDHGGLLQRMREFQNQNPVAFRTALLYAGTGRALPPEAGDAAQQMTEYLVPRLNRMAGANVTPEERERVTQGMGLGWTAAVGNPDAFINGLRRLIDQEQADARGAAVGLPRQAVLRTYADVMGRDEAYWDQRIRRSE